jgi:hypothetical protein
MTRMSRTRQLFVIVVLIIIAVGIAAFALIVRHHQTQPPMPILNNSASLAKPSIPTNGAYVGAWVNPQKLSESKSDEPGVKEIQQLPMFNQQLGSHVNILHVYTAFDRPLPTDTLNSIQQNGSIPMVDWACTNTQDIISGKDDSIIATYAQSMKAYSKPVFLRWYWEMNQADSNHKSCNGSGAKYAGDFVSAWQHIWNIFQQQGAGNVAFVWSPSGDNDAAAYYPGDKYVDWIGVDHYDIDSRNGSGQAAVNSLFGDFYNEWQSHEKPMMIAETGATPDDQVAYFQALQALLPSQYPDFKALVYFDSIGDGNDGKGPWNLSSTGFGALRTLVDSTYFNQSTQN